MSILSRRSLMTAAASIAAVPAVAVLPAVADPVSNPDACLFDLVKQYEDASKEIRLRCAEFDCFEGKEIVARKAAEEARPDVLRVRAEDHDLGLPEPYRNANKIGEFYELPDIERLREEKWERFKNVVMEPTDVLAVADFLRRFEFLHERYTPTPEARVRADEIIQASDDWHAGYKKVPRGFRAAERRMHIALNKQDRIGRKIAATRASTIAGMKAKARCVAKEFLDEGSEDHLGIAVSIMRDLTALAA